MSRSHITAGCPWGGKYLNILSNSVKQTWTLRFRKQTIGKNLKQCLNLILFSLITLWQTEKKTHLFYDKVGFPRALASRRVGPRIENSILRIHQLCSQCEEHLVSVIKNSSFVGYWSAKGQHKGNVSAPIFLPSTTFVKYSNEVSLSNNNCFYGKLNWTMVIVFPACGLAQGEWSELLTLSCVTIYGQ